MSSAFCASRSVHPAVYVAFEPLLRLLLRELIRPQGAQGREGAVGKDDFDLLDVLFRLPVLERALAAGIVVHDAADGRELARGRVGLEHEAPLGERLLLEIAVVGAGLGDGVAAGTVTHHGQHFVHVFRKTATTESVRGPPLMSVPAERAVTETSSPAFLSSATLRTRRETSSASSGRRRPEAPARTGSYRGSSAPASPHRRRRRLSSRSRVRS